MVDFAALLERMIAEADDPSRRREIVFELARATLRRQLQQHARTLDPADAAAHMASLEAAIATCATMTGRPSSASVATATTVSATALPAAARSVADASAVAASASTTSASTASAFPQADIPVPAENGIAASPLLADASRGFATNPQEGDRIASHGAGAGIPDSVDDAWSSAPRATGRDGRGRRPVERDTILAFSDPMPLFPFAVEPIAAVAGRDAVPRRWRRSARRWSELALAAVLPLVVYAAVVPRDGAGRPEVAGEAAGRRSPSAETARRDAEPVGPELAAARTGPSGEGAATDPHHTALAALPPSPTLPTLYGVYAVQGTRFTELEQVQTSPVDPRVRTVLQIKTATKTLLPDRDLRFLVFRREMMTNAPERVPVRIAARLAKVMTFDPSGKVVTAPPGEERWVIRETGFEFRVRPMRDHPEMIWVQPEDPSSPVPAGRYVLMINGTPYDFTVEGPVTEPAHCLESVGTSRGPTLYECQPK
ncbi:hypothetical protein [Rhodoplanes sp. SY1]|uniref:hypothetical protein n=1 Tax=Rhodoplanes sp. SY1 TaxID=3166646 RepID=UPI0038B41B79